MNRRDLLGLAGASTLAGFGGCLERVQESDGAGQESDDTERTDTAGDDARETDDDTEADETREDDGGSNDEDGSEPSDEGDENGAKRDENEGAGSEFEIRDLEPVEATILEREEFEIGAAVANAGSEEDTQTVDFGFDGYEVPLEHDVTLAPDETETVSFDVWTEPFEPGEYTYTVSTADDEASGTLIVEAKPYFFEVTDLELSATEITAGEPVDVSARVTNTGRGAGTQEIELLADDEGYHPDGEERLATESVTLDPGEDAAVSFDGVELEPETYRIVVASEDDETSGGVVVGDLFERLEELEAEATPLEFESVNGMSDVVNYEPDEWHVHPLVQTADSEPLEQLESETGSNPGLYGFVVRAADRIDRQNLDRFDFSPDGDDPGAEFVDETDFETQSLLVFQYSAGTQPTIIDVEFVGALSDDRSYVRMERETGPLAAPSQATALVRVDDPLPTTDLLVGETHGAWQSDGPRTPALHTNREGE